MTRKALIEAVALDPLDLLGIDELIGLHRTDLLRLTSSVEADKHAHYGGDPYALVTEVLRLARLGALAEERAAPFPNERVGNLVKEARDRWRVEIGGA